jgi:hypothetical protein
MEYLWLVLQYRESKDFDVQGIFTSREKAIAACVTDQFSIMRLVPDEQLPVEKMDAPHNWYPLLEKEPQ